jgi:ribose 5-phosphate isomerase RpiB
MNTLAILSDEHSRSVRVSLIDKLENSQITVVDLGYVPLSGNEDHQINTVLEGRLTAIGSIENQIIVLLSLYGNGFAMHINKFDEIRASADSSTTSPYDLVDLRINSVEYRSDLSLQTIIDHLREFLRLVSRNI